MNFPEAIKFFHLDNEEEILDRLNELSPQELLALQAVADKITELILIVYLAREEYGMRKTNGTDTEV